MVSIMTTQNGAQLLVNCWTAENSARHRQQQLPGSLHKWNCRRIRADGSPPPRRIGDGVDVIIKSHAPYLSYNRSVPTTKYRRRAPVMAIDGSTIYPNAWNEERFRQSRISAAQAASAQDD